MELLKESNELGSIQKFTDRKNSKQIKTQTELMDEKLTL